MYNYPTLEEINKADRIQIARWYRFLPMPGANHLGSDDFLEKCHEETYLMFKINDRFEALGGMTPELSKAISWR